MTRQVAPSGDMRNDRAMIRPLVPAALGGLACLVLAGCASAPAPSPASTVTKTRTARPSPISASGAGPILVPAGPFLTPEACVRVTTGADGNVGLHNADPAIGRAPYVGPWRVRDADSDRI